MNLAIVETGGKQYLVTPKLKIQVEKLAGEAGSAIMLEKVLLTAAGSKIEVGKPYISAAAVKAKIIKQARAKKVTVFKYKAKSKYRRKAGHRQQYTELEIEAI